jgi:Na+-transporting NADH:ubiquinone oxidoreductase subunit NqrD
MSGTKGPSSVRRVTVIALAVALPLGALHWVLLLAGAPRSARLIVDLILIAGVGLATVNLFRAYLRASQEEVKRNPKPW